MVRQKRTIDRAFYVSTIATWRQNKAATLLIAIHTPIRNGMPTSATAAGVTVHQKGGVHLSQGGYSLMERC